MGKGRKPCCDKAGVKKGPWSQAEDFKLISFIQHHGHSNWRALPKLAGLARCGKSCRLRWVNYLRPDLKRGNFTPQEEETIIKLHEELGNKWSKIASKFPGRTDNEIKNVWNTHLKKRLKAKESKKKSQDSCHSPPTSTSTDEEVLNGSSKDECSEQNLVNQTKSVDETIEHSTSSSASCTSQELFLDQEMEDLTPLLDDLGVLSPIMVENTSNKDDASAILDKGNKSNPLEELIEIPFEPNLDLWDLLDGGVQSNSADFSDVHFNEVDTPLNLVPDIDNNNNNNNNNDNASNIDVNNTENGGSWWWLVYLENELGLEHNQATSAAQSSSTIGSNQQGSLIQGS